MEPLRLAREWFVPGGLVVAGLGAWFLLAPDTGMLESLSRGYPWAVYASVLFLAWRFRRSRVAAAVLVIALVDRGVPALAPTHTAVATGASAYLLPLVLAFVALLRDGSVMSVRGGVQILAALALAGAGLGTLLLRPEGAAAFLDTALVPRSLVRWTGLPPMAVVSLVGATVVVGLAAWWRPGPVEKGLLWVIPASALAFNAGIDTSRGTLWLMAAGVVLGLSVLELSYAMAYEDELTGLPGRRALKQTLGELRKKYTLAMVDVDHFKKFNDRHGHDVGDQVLKMVAGRLERVGGGGKAFRYGGEEFTLIFPGKGIDDVIPRLDAVRRAVEKSTFTVRSWDRPRKAPEGARGKGGGKKDLSVTVSLGAAEAGDDAQTPEEVMDAADQALYRAKQKGRNRVVKARS